MRRALIVLLIAGLVTAVARAQEAPKTLVVAKSLLAVKITDPARQVTAFEPLLTRIDGLVADLGHTDKRPSEEMAKGLAGLAQVPGIDATGTFWFVVQPQEGKAPAPPPQPEKKDGEGAAPARPLPNVTAALLIPLKDAAAFRQFAGDPARKDRFGGAQVFDGYAVVGQNLPAFAGVDAAMTLVSTRDIVVVTRLVGNPLAMLGQMDGPMAGFLAPIADLMAGYAANMESTEMGLAMVGDDLSLEGFVTPVPGSPLAKSLAAPDAARPEELAGLLPENLAFCSASGPMLAGSPGTGYTLSRLGVGMLSSFLDEKTGPALVKALDDLAAQCGQGRAIGLTTPPATLATRATLVAAYQVAKPTEAAAALHAFFDTATRTRDALLGGMLTDVLQISKPIKEMIGATPVETIKMSLATGEAEAGKPAPKPFALELRFAFTNDKMLMAIGDGSRAELENMIARAKGGPAGYTAGKRFLALKARLPEHARAFESFATLDLCRAAVSLAPVDAEQKTKLAGFLKIFPEQRSVLHDYSEIRDGRIHSEFRIPGEQIDFLGTLIKAAVTFFPTKPKPVVTPAEPEKPKPAPAKPKPTPVKPKPTPKPK